MVNIQTQIKSLVLVARPIHWVKNLSVFAALIFSGLLYNKVYFINTFLTFWIFSFAASATYILNDIFDAKRDRLHPIKRNRPIASGNLPVALGILELIVLVFLSLSLANLISNALFLLTVTYLIMQVLYSSFLKNLPIIDIIIIATGFVIRVYAGAFAINAHLSVWFLLCVISVALFLASGKRRAELNVLKETNEITRKSLVRYQKELLNSYVTMFGNASWVSWALYTFFESPKASLPFWLVLAEISRTTTVNKLLMATIPIVIFGIMRYEALIFEGKSEAPEKVLLTDKGLIIASILWIFIVYWILYSGVSVSGI